MQIFLEWGDPSTVDGGSRTPLSWAAGNGHRYIVKMLLEWESAAPDIVDKHGRTPLSWAAKNGHCGGASCTGGCYSQHYRNRWSNNLS